MTVRQLRRIYLVTGLDRQLYSRRPQWPEGTFENTSDYEGVLTLVESNINSRSELDAAIKRLDRRAECFRLAISRQLVRTVQVRLRDSQEPDVDPPGEFLAIARADATAECELSITPRSPPEVMPQLSPGATRWVTTLGETSSFSDFPDEVIKRYYLIIEELWEKYEVGATQAQKDEQRALLYVRNFVSHDELDRKGAREYIAQHLPSAIVAQNPLKVRFDRSSPEHRNFVGSYAARMQALANWLLDQAIVILPPA